MTNKSKDVLQNLKKEQSYSNSDFDTYPMLSDKNVNIQKNIELSETSSYLMQKINDLPEKYRVIILRRYYDDMSYEEIADIIHVKVGTVKSRLFKARELLRQSISQDGQESIFEN